MSLFLALLLLAMLVGGAALAALAAALLRWVGLTLAIVALVWGAVAIFGQTAGAWVLIVLAGLVLVLGLAGQALEYRKRRALKASLAAASARYEAEQYAREVEQFGLLDAEMMRAERARMYSAGT